MTAPEDPSAVRDGSTTDRPRRDEADATVYAGDLAAPSWVRARLVAVLLGAVSGGLLGAVGGLGTVGIAVSAGLVAVGTLVVAVRGPGARGVGGAHLMTVAVLASLLLTIRILDPVERVDDPSLLRYVLVDGPGGGVLVLLLPAALVVVLGALAFRLPPRDQWGGSFAITARAVRLGVLSGVVLAAVTLAVAIPVAGADPNVTVRAMAANAFSNLYEEIIFRGALLVVVARLLGVRTAIVWTTVVFGLSHGFGAVGIVITLTSFVLAWAVVRARSLWAGWIGHQVADMIIDSFVT